MRNKQGNQEEVDGGRTPAGDHRTVVQQGNCPRLKLERE